MEVTTFAPVLIPTLNRYEHFKRCVESLAKCTHADKTELVIGLDYPPAEKYVEGWKRICDYIPQVGGFRKVTILDCKENLGATENFKRLHEYAASNYDRYILTEDDNEFSPCFLDFMNKGLEVYKDDSRIFTISGYLEPKFICIVNEGVVFMPTGNAWGLGVWTQKEYEMKKRIATILEDTLFSFRKSLKVFRCMPARLQGAIICYNNNYNYGDVKRGLVCNVYDMFQARPAKSLVRNWGQDGTGLHSGINPAITKEEISDDYLYELYNTPVVLRNDVAQLLKSMKLPSDTIRRQLKVFKILLEYILFRVNNLINCSNAK